MKTNFEKWKETLTPESLIADNGQVALWCCICPAKGKTRKCLACGHGYVIDCTIEMDEMVRPMVPAGGKITQFLVD